MWSPKLLNRLPAGKFRLSLIDKQMAVSAAKAISIPDNATVIEINSGWSLNKIFRLRISYARST